MTIPCGYLSSTILVELYVLLLMCMAVYGSSVVMLLLLLMLILNFGWILFILLEVALVPLVIYTISGGGYERSSANLWMVVIGYIVGILMVCSWGVSSSLLLVTFLLAKVPIYGLHGWLPNLHVESSLFGSIILAGVVLNFALVPLYWMMGLSILPVILLSALSLLNSVDGNWLIAISSVVHITAGVVLLSCVVYLMWGGVAHFVVSPMLFYLVYVSYNTSGSRYLVSGNNIVMLILLLINLGFPLLSSFYIELPLMMTIFGVVIFTVNSIWFLKLRTSITLVNWEYILIFVVVMFIL